MTAVGTPNTPGMTGAGPEDAEAAARLVAVARELGEAAGAVRAAELAVAAVAGDPALLASLARSPRRGLQAATALARGLAGLGCVPGGGRTALVAGAVVRRGGLAAGLAATALRLRIRLCTTRHAEYAAEGPVRRMLVAVEAGLPDLALRILRESVRVRSAGPSLAALTPALEEVTAWHALACGKPFNDAAAWHTVMGTGLPGDHRAGSVPLPAVRSRRSRRPEPAVEPLDRVFPDGLDESGGITAHLRNLAALGPGRMLTRQLTGPDGTTRCLVLLPGPEFVLPRTASPEELAGAVAALGRGDLPYALTARDVLRRTVPEGMPVALVGHGPGGVTALRLAGVPERAAPAVTQVVTVGSPAGPRHPHAAGAPVAALTEEHDLLPRLEGRSPVPVLPPHPGRLEIAWADPSFDVPQCHGAETYARSLDKTATEARDRVDELLAPYRGRAGRTVVHRLPGG
ncbi:hypothetical protein [Streptomyces sp. NPDC008001]|uniref:hypothetical protein n=1 Tax=Streptomyces sp. NPDC008001 TaxID=3364804 RepID=UPI0036E13D68